MFNALLAIATLLTFACSYARASDSLDDATRIKYANSAHEALQRGDYAFAESALNDVLRSLPKDSTLDRAAMSAMLVDLGDAQRGQDKGREALNTYKKAEKLLQSSSGVVPDETAAALNYGLSAYWLSEEKSERALPYAQLAYDLRKQLNSDKLSDSARQLAEIQTMKGLLDDAVTLFKEAIDVNERVNAGMPQTADIMEELATLYFQQGKLDQCNALLEQARNVKEGTGAVFRQWCPQALSQQVVFHYNSNSSASSRPAGSPGFAITANGITVIVEPRDRPSTFFATTRIIISVINDSNQTVTVLSQPPSLSTLARHSKMARYFEPETVAQEIEKKGKSKADDLKYTSEHATRSQTTTVNVSQYRSGWGYVTVPKTQTIQVPDYDTRDRARLQMDQTISQYLAEANLARTQSLHTLCQVMPKSSVSGFIDFSRLKYKQARLRLTIGNSIFEFVLPGNEPSAEAEQKLLLKHDL